MGEHSPGVSASLMGHAGERVSTPARILWERPWHTSGYCAPVPDYVEKASEHQQASDSCLLLDSGCNWEELL